MDLLWDHAQDLPAPRTLLGCISTRLSSSSNNTPSYGRTKVTGERVFGMAVTRPTCPAAPIADRASGVRMLLHAFLLQSLNRGNCDDVEPATLPSLMWTDTGVCLGYDAICRLQEERRRLGGSTRCHLFDQVNGASTLGRNW